MEYKNNYENVFIIKGTYTEGEYKKALDNIIENIKTIVNIDNIEEKGLKKLAYEVKKNKTGYYVIIYLKATSQAITEVERLYRINEDILKFITVRKED